MKKKNRQNRKFVVQESWNTDEEAAAGKLVIRGSRLRNLALSPTGELQKEKSYQLPMFNRIFAHHASIIIHHV
jgi:hypothetical protein